MNDALTRLLLIWLLASPTAVAQTCGDCDGDGSVEGQLADAVYLLHYNFLGGEAPPCRASCDVNGDGRVTGQVTDAVYLLTYNFRGGPAPVAPFPNCGGGVLDSDATLGCERSPENCR